MSKLFYDHLINNEELDALVKSASETAEEREELWRLIDEIIHHRVLGCVLDHLPRQHHKEFMEKLHKAPHDETLIEYLSDKVQKNMEEIIKQEIGELLYELINQTSTLE